MAERYDACRGALEARGQEHLLRWWDELSVEERATLLDEIDAIPWDRIDPLIESHVRSTPTVAQLVNVTPPSVYPRDPGDEHRDLYAAAYRLGIDQLRAGKVAAFTVAGGQGTRLGFDGPKGAVAITPVRKKPLFQLFAETLGAARERYRTAIPWYIMTSPFNHRETLEFFQGHDFFGLPKDDVMLFSQEMLPSFAGDGRILMADRHRLALSPDGHGGSLKALVASGAVADMERRAVEIISYFQVDNPLVHPFDPLFIGLHAHTESEMSSKVIPKVDDLERLGNVCVADGELRVIEYSDFPDELARARNPDGSRTFDVGSIAIHLFSTAFVERIIARNFSLPYHQAKKKVAHIDDDGAVQNPDDPNAIKLETFVFDALPLARNPLILETDRAEEFSPAKNPTGVDSVESAIRDQVRRAARWLESVGSEIPRDENGEVQLVVEIAPSYALDAQGLSTSELPELPVGGSVYLD